jgi:hypothetical protein
LKPRAATDLEFDLKQPELKEVHHNMNISNKFLFFETYCLINAMGCACNALSNLHCIYEAVYLNELEVIAKIERTVSIFFIRLRVSYGVNQ